MYDHKDGVRLRKLHKGDLHPLLALKQESWWGTHSTLIANIEDQIQWFDNIGHNALYMIAEKSSNVLVSAKRSETLVPVGIACYTEIDWYGRTLNISGSIFKSQRKDWDGIVKPAFSAGLDFAFEVLNMHRVGAEVLETHAAAQKLELGHLGFTIEGRRRKVVYKAGRYYDSIVLGLLRDEWEKHERVLAYNGCCNNNFDHDLADKAIVRFNRVYLQASDAQ